MFKFKIDHPYRPTNWRWERARLLKEYGRAVPGQDKDDEYTRIASRFRVAKEKCKTEIDIFKLYEKYPKVASAYEIWDEETVAIQGRANPMRYEIEARILAREPLEAISKKSKINLDVLEWYEKLFFNVLDRIENHMYIMHIVIGDAAQRGMSDREYSVLWKLYAYIRGPHMLDFLISTFADWKFVDKGQAEKALVDDHRSTMKRKAALASRMISLNGHTQDRLIELHTRIVEIEKSTELNSSVGSEAVNANIQVMLSHLPLLVGQQVSSDSRADLLKPYAKLPGELRAHEMLNLTADIPVDIKQLEHFKYPEPNTDGKEIN